MVFWNLPAHVEGLFLMLAPSWVLTAIGIPDPESVWRIVLGFVVIVLGYYYVRIAKENLTPFFVFTIQIRIIQFGSSLYGSTFLKEALLRL